MCVCVEVIVRPLDIYQTKFSVCGLARTHTLAMPITLSAFICFAHLTRPSHTLTILTAHGRTRRCMCIVCSTLHTYLPFNFLVFVVCVLWSLYFISAAVRSMFFNVYSLSHSQRTQIQSHSNDFILFLQSFACALGLVRMKGLQAQSEPKPNAYTQMCSHIKMTEWTIRSFVYS